MDLIKRPSLAERTKRLLKKRPGIKKAKTLVAKAEQAAVEKVAVVPAKPSWEEKLTRAWDIVHNTYPKITTIAEAADLFNANLPFNSRDGQYTAAANTNPLPQTMHCGIGYIHSWGYDDHFTELKKSLFILWCEHQKANSPYGLLYTTTADNQKGAIECLTEAGWWKSPEGSNHSHDYRMAAMWILVNHPVAHDPKYKRGNYGY